jgi:hypothetical protein
MASAQENRQVADKDMTRIIDLKAGSAGATDSLSRVICPLCAGTPEGCTDTGGRGQRQATAER